MGPLFYLTLAGGFTHAHQDGEGGVNSLHTAISSWNEIIIMTRIPEFHKEYAMDVMNKESGTNYNAFRQPHCQAQNDRPGWPTNDTMAEWTRMG
jgi:hypothetical protein